jgi:hypothetical protein
MAYQKLFVKSRKIPLTLLGAGLTISEMSEEKRSWAVISPLQSNETSVGLGIAVSIY